MYFSFKQGTTVIISLLEKCMCNINHNICLWACGLCRPICFSLAKIKENAFFLINEREVKLDVNSE